MTGRELIIYILLNGLENEKIDGIMNENEAAEKINVGVSTIRTSFKLGIINGLQIGENVYIFNTTNSLEQKGGNDV